MKILGAVDLDTDQMIATEGALCDTYQAIGVGAAL